MKSGDGATIKIRHGPKGWRTAQHAGIAVHATDALAMSLSSVGRRTSQERGAVGLIGTLKLRTDSSSSTSPAAAQPVNDRAGCPAPAAPGERALCASDTDVLGGHGQPRAALRVQLDQVIAQLQDAASHARPARAVGTGCSPRSGGDGIGAPA